MYFGADYYPEHWPRERWETDARLMREAYFNVVRLAEFSWIKLEPEENSFDFAWLDEAIGVLAKEGIKVVLGTPTATPPKWIVDKDPDVYYKDVYGRTVGFGTRRHYCFNSPAYHLHTQRIVTAMAEHYKDNPNVVAWQIDNEFGSNNTWCYCQNCLEAFKKWLKAKYGTIEKLNSEWGTVFWSQCYRNWDELILPIHTACGHGNHNPGMMLDYRRFCSDSVVAYQKMQIDIIRGICSRPITHNLMGHASEVDNFDLARDLDFVSWDNYPGFGSGRVNGYKIDAMAHDLMRGVKSSNFWIMEQQSGPCGWGVIGDTPKPGQLRLWTYQGVAHGAEGMVYFRWRACTLGIEQYWYGILDHDGVPRRRYREIQQTGREMRALSDLVVGSRVLADVAIIKSYDNLWCHQPQSHHPKFNYNELLMEYYFALIDNNICSDVTSIESDLSRYKAVIMPAFNLMKQSIKDKIEEYVKNGGTLVVTFRSGTRTWNNTMTTETLPGSFKDMAGVEVEEFDCLNNDRQIGLTGDLGAGTATIWCDILKTTGARVVAAYDDDYYKGQPAVTVNEYGNGKVYYVGCSLDGESMKKLIELVARGAGAKPVLQQKTEGVEIVRKEKDGKDYLMIMNHRNEAVTIEVEGSYTDALSESKVDGTLALQPYGVAVLV